MAQRFKRTAARSWWSTETSAMGLRVGLLLQTLEQRLSRLLAGNLELQAARLTATLTKVLQRGLGECIRLRLTLLKALHQITMLTLAQGRTAQHFLTAVRQAFMTHKETVAQSPQHLLRQAQLRSLLYAPATKEALLMPSQTSTT